MKMNESQRDHIGEELYQIVETTYAWIQFLENRDPELLRYFGEQMASCFLSANFDKELLN